MTTLILQTAGQVAGGAVGGLAGPIGAAAGRVLGGAAGLALDAALFGDASPRHVEGPRLTEMGGLASTEGAPVPRVYGRARIGGQLIWATRFEEVAAITVERARTGAKSSRAARTTTTTYTYYANLAVGLCEGPVAFIRRVWADGRELDLTLLTLRLHRGTEDQEPDPLVVAKEGAENAPAYRGLAYAVFERLDLSPFGNRVPQFQFEVVRAVEGLGGMIRAVCLIPGATEHGYDPLPVTASLGLGRTIPQNRHQLGRETDVLASLDALQALCPNLERVSLVVSWFGDDLRAGHCTVAPRVEGAEKATTGDAWQVAGLSRAEARVVSTVGGAAAYGGTPSDAGVVRLIGELRARGLGVVLYPFLMMDVPAGNALPDPRGGAGQPPYPWRGRITCSPAPGLPGTADLTPEAAAQVARFFGEARAADFAVIRGEVAYSGPEEWSLRRLALHYAHLAGLAGGVEGFILGSELVGLTRVRSAPGTYPAVDHLVRLAAELRAALAPGTGLTYAADWTEYGAHVTEGGAALGFPLDPLWASPAIDAVGIDYYPPISDWRDGEDHLDLAEARGIHDVDYLRRRLASGEAFDWFYAGEADRLAQARTPIIDGAWGRPWAYRAKDLAGWWASPHVARADGQEIGATAWVPRSKPIWLTEVGVPAVDKGPNGPNVFPDPKSAESAHPPLSRGTRDDLVQARALEAILTRFDAALPGHPRGANPVSPLYGGPMVDPARVFVWAWDARPFPAFPDFAPVWADAANWETGHWLNGRLEGVPLDRLVAAVLADDGVAAERPALDGWVDGFVVDRPMSAREALDALCRVFGVDAMASGGALRFQGRGGRPVATIPADELVQAGEAPLLRLTRTEAGELPSQVELGFTDGEAEYRRAAAVARRRGLGSSGRQAGLDAAIVTRRAEAGRLAETCLQDLWAARETARFRLSPRRIDLEPGDVVRLVAQGGPRLHRITRILDGAAREVETRAVEPVVFAAPTPAAPRRTRRPPPVAGPSEVVVLDLPAARGDPPALQHLAVAADPWPGTVAVWRSLDGAGFALHRLVGAPALVGRLLDPLPPGPLWRWDPAASLRILLSGEGPASISDEAALAGGNLFAVRGEDGGWEIVAAARAELVAPRTYRLGRLLRGLAGSEMRAGRAAPAGSAVVRLDGAVAALATGPDDLGRPWRYRVGPADRGPLDPAAVEVAATAGAGALRPLAPVHLAARRSPDGVEIAWTRRARIGGDAWEPAEVPLAEEAEVYEVDVLGPAGVVRTLGTTAPRLLYAAADERADLGGPQARLRLRVAQVSAAVGRGHPAEATVPVL